MTNCKTCNDTGWIRKEFKLPYTNATTHSRCEDCDFWIKIDWKFYPRNREENSPNHGGCWFCSKGNGFKEDGQLLFDTEFDTFVHEDCLRKAIDKGDVEAKLMAYLISDEKEVTQ